MKKVLRILACCCLSLFVITSIALAEEKEEAKEEEKKEEAVLEEIVVTATRTERAVKDLAATVSIVTKEEIEASNVNSATDILNMLPGVFVHKTGPFGRADATIRGLGDRVRTIMVLVDGRPEKMGLFGCTITHSLPLDNVERIEVVRGPASVLYGSDALGGVINIITRKPEKLEADALISYGSYDTQIYRLRQGNKLDRFNYYFTGDWRKTAGHLPNSAYDGKNLTARMGYELSENLELTFTGRYFDGYKEEPLRATDPPTKVPDIWNDYERGAIDLTLSGKWEKWNGLAKVYRNFGEHEFSDGWHSEDFTNGMVLHGSARLFTGNELTMGLELRQQGGKKLATAKQPKAGEWDKTEYAVFFHDEQTLLEKLILTFGARYNYDDVSGSDLSPQAGLVFHPIEGTIFRGTINKGFRSPQLNELYMFPPSNPDLKPERVWNYEVGINQRIVKGLYFDLVGFLMKGEDLIERDPTTKRFQNIGEFEFKGIEAGLNVQFNKELSGSIYYSYLYPGEKTKGRPGDKFDLVLMYIENKLAASLSGQYVTDYFAADKKQKPIGDYFVAGAKVSYEIKRGIRPFLAVDNIFGEKYEIYVDLPGAEAGLFAMPRTALTAGLSFVF